MLGTIAITDEGWYTFLRNQTGLQEVNFWTPSARRAFRADPFSPFIFKLRAPHNAICGFAFFAQYSRLPVWLAWESFGVGNGCASQAEMESRIASLREGIRYEADDLSDDIGCIQLVQPIFFPRDAWIPQPSDWHPRTQRSQRYDLDTGEGRRVWDACASHGKSLDAKTITASVLVAESAARYGTPIFVEPRLGQGTFRVAVMDAYERSCAITEEHSLPALEAAHIQPYSSDGPHDVRNGLLLRADFHRLFDKGYITVTPQLRLVVGTRLKHDFKNGRSYYPLDGALVRAPNLARLKPASEFLAWHNDKIFRG